MLLQEFKAKQLLQEVGIACPTATLDEEKAKQLCFPLVVKAQVPSGKRLAQGLVRIAHTLEDLPTSIAMIREKTAAPLLFEELAKGEKWYVGITYDTLARKPVLLFSEHGGSCIEEQEVQTYVFDPDEFTTTLESLPEDVHAIFKKLWSVFTTYDARLLEINPLFKAETFVAADAKCIIDDAALFRQDFAISDDAYVLSEREEKARAIDRFNYRGVSGKCFIDLEGDIAIMTSGGGVSLVCMDTLLLEGGKPANFVEYSGNPPREKVKALTEIVLSKPKLKGCLVVGAKANFTDIFETLSGFCEGISSLKKKPSFPIIIRRAGPRDQEAFAMVKAFAEEHQLDIELYGEELPITEAVKRMMEKSNVS